MSVTTKADEEVDKAYEHVKDAIKNLAEVVVNECWGYSEYNQEYKDILHETMNSLMEIKRKLK